MIFMKITQSLNDNRQVTEAKIALEKLMRLWENADLEYIEYQEALAFSEQVNLAN